MFRPRVGSLLFARLAAPQVAATLRGSHPGLTPVRRSSTVSASPDGAPSSTLDNLSNLLISRFGQSTTVQFRRVVRRRSPAQQAMDTASDAPTSHALDDDDAEHPSGDQAGGRIGRSSPAAPAHTSSGGGGAAATTSFRASVTTRVGGFGLTLATAVDSADSSTACESAAAMAVSSDVDSIDPDKEPVFAKLRFLALGLGRMLRFSIAAVDPGGKDGPATGPDDCFRCRAFEKDDWQLGNNHAVIAEACGATPRAAFIAALYGVCDKYKVEADASPKGLEDVAELRKYLALSGKTAEDPHISKKTEGTSTKFVATVTVKDAYDNTYSVSSGPTPTAYAACRSCALQVYKHEADVPVDTFATRLRWTIDGLCDHALRLEETKALLDLATTGGFKYAPSLDSGEQIVACEPELAVDSQELGHGNGHYATVYYGNRELAQRQAAGAYLAEINALASACEVMMGKYPAMASDIGMPLQSVADIGTEYRQTCGFSAVDALKGSKISPYGVLGSCCAKHFKQYYAVTYTSLDSTTHRSTVHVEDVSRLGQKRVIGTAVSKTRGQAWKAACLNALRCNFPQQLEQVQDRSDFKAHGDATPPGKEAATEALLKAMAKLPRATRIERCANLQQMVEMFGQAELGWKQVELVSEQDDRDLHWRCELRCRNLRDGSWISLAKGRPAAAKKDAVKLTAWVAASQYFPKDLETYLSLGRSDVTRADMERLNRRAPFSTENSVVRNILSALSRDGAPARIVVEAGPDHANARTITVSVYRGEDRIATESTWPADVEEHPVGKDGKIVWSAGDKCALVPVVVAALNAAAAVSSMSSRVGQLWTAHRGYSPPGVQKLQDFSDFLFGTVLGAVPKPVSELVANAWVTRIVVDAPAASARGGTTQVVLGTAVSLSKKESVKAAIVASLQRNFGALLCLYRASTMELKQVADEILRAPRYFVANGQPVPVAAGTVATDIGKRAGGAGAAAAASGAAAGSAEGEQKARLSGVAARRAAGGAGSDTAPPPPTPGAAAAADVAGRSGPPAAPYKLLKSRTRRDMPEMSVAPEYGADDSDPDAPLHVCKLRLQPIDPGKAKGRVAQIIGEGTGTTKANAVHNAALAALDSMFTEELEAIVNAFPEWADEPDA
jgi:hypothetical protein